MINLNFRNWPTAITLMFVALIVGILIYTGKIEKIWTSEGVITTHTQKIESKNEEGTRNIAGTYKMIVLYQNIKLYYQLKIEQDGSNLRGNGMKLGEQTITGRWISTSTHLSVHLTGVWNDGKWQIQMTEEGKNEKTYLTELTLHYLEQTGYTGKSKNKEHGQATIQLKSVDDRLSIE